MNHCHYHHNSRACASVVVVVVVAGIRRVVGEGGIVAGDGEDIVAGGGEDIVTGGEVGYIRVVHMPFVAAWPLAGYSSCVQDRGSTRPEDEGRRDIAGCRILGH